MLSFPKIQTIAQGLSIIQTPIKAERKKVMTENGNGSMVMPVSPMYGGGNGGFGGWGSDIWLILIVLFAFGGWGNGFGGGFGGGYGNMMLGYDFPWLLNGQSAINANTNNGFQNALLNDNVTSIRDSISGLSTQLCGCCGDIQSSLCNGFNSVNMSVNNAQNALAQQMYTNQISDLQRSFDSQTAVTSGMNNIGMSLQNCCCENRAGIADVKYTLATEACATRNNDTQNTQSILNTINGGIQSIKDQLCQDKIDSKNDTIAQLRQELLYARGQDSQDLQTQRIIDGTYSRLSQCPVGSVPVFGNQPIFTCAQNVAANNMGCGCGCSNF